MPALARAFAASLAALVSSLRRRHGRRRRPPFDHTLLQDPEALVEIVIQDPASPPLHFVSRPGGTLVCGTVRLLEAQEEAVRFVVEYPEEPGGRPTRPFYYGANIAPGVSDAADQCEESDRRHRSASAIQVSD